MSCRLKLVRPLFLDNYGCGIIQVNDVVMLKQQIEAFKERISTLGRNVSTTNLEIQTARSLCVDLKGSLGEVPKSKTRLEMLSLLMGKLIKGYKVCFEAQTME